MHFVTLAINDVEHNGTDTVSAASVPGGVIICTEHVARPPHDAHRHRVYHRNKKRWKAFHTREKTATQMSFGGMVDEAIATVDSK